MTLAGLVSVRRKVPCARAIPGRHHSVHRMFLGEEACAYQVNSSGKSQSELYLAYFYKTWYITIPCSKLKWQKRGGHGARWGIEADLGRKWGCDGPRWGGGHAAAPSPSSTAASCSAALSAPYSAGCARSVMGRVPQALWSQLEPGRIHELYLICNPI